MTTYIDTGVLLKSYVWEHNSMDAIALIQAADFPLAFSHFHAIEIPNAIALKRFRRELTVAQENAALAAFESDATSGRLARPDYDLGSVFVRATTLSRKYSAAIGTRSMDILHVAAALESGCREFVSFDERQNLSRYPAGAAY